ncbi:putative cobalt-precorrin-6Y C(15)-methyltransferase [Clostridium acetireducens DSM 10703]|uniref:Putative cobalt-precorrin-6Y C(15)-methyltransferase n=1 Tax=Clostridium acetireducens DSM 10703 TaxID=1121290 RepID=A0A1E8EZV3_9CLOT|nr:precorrin-6Y C5,15-methyltransferase (decarboxylating) subunit CbiT [Clostridium acetireducens]OFI06704.1 putative cobalt-precorrin-6Y C(15)-methyltransferase [Clostridium acetireducens DSM 10703]
MNYIKDEEFIRGQVPMTKEEIRILTIAKLGIKENSKVLDVGAGTGSISIQIAKMFKNVEVFAIEKEEEAVGLIHKNKEKFNIDNLSIIKGEAIEVSENINEKFDSIFIGGSKGNIKDIIDIYNKKLNVNGKMVMNFITLSNLEKALSKLEELGYKVECIQVSISKFIGKSLMAKANNPVFILSAEKE